ncbi:hypothetical protein HKX48_003869 [Thoreauomyces humboldtii]|nr:hypothetical protein HKX48_003869 [Thoreauomyces humboldtii]
MFSAVRNRDLSTLRSLLQQSESSVTTSSNAPRHGSASGSGSLGKHNGAFLSKHRSSSTLIVDPNGRDAEGACPLHVAIALGQEEVILALLQCSKVNPNLQDVESGYTPLHKAVYDGNLRLALQIIRVRSDCDLSLRDREGNTCLDLLMSTMAVADATSPQRRKNKEAESDDESVADETDRRQDRGQTTEILDPATSLWTWGANTNYILGHANSDDRAYPEQVDITATYKKRHAYVTATTFSSHEPLLQSVVLSKYHSAIVTSKQLFANGFGAGGRLGLGNEETVLRPTAVSGITGEVADLALGPEHTIAVTRNGEVYTWGSNKYGQLGYLTEGIGQNPCELAPREVGGVIKKIRIMGVAASRHHSAAFSDTGAIYTWGLSVGQLGYPQPLNTSHAHPKKITDFPQQPLLQLSATKNATAVLTCSHDVFVFAESKFSRVTFAFQQFPKEIRVHHPRGHAAAPVITKIVSGNHQFAALASSGDVFVWSPPEAQFQETWQQQAFPQKKPKKVWSVRKKHLAARDVAIGIDSSLIIRTDNGHVYVGLRRKQTKQKVIQSMDSDASQQTVYFKYHKIPFLQHAEKVAASASGGFAVTRLDKRPPAVHVPSCTLRDHLRTVLSRTREGDKGISEDAASAAADVMFTTRDNQQVRAHRAILACRSSAFRRVFADPATSTLPSLTVRLENATWEVDCPQWHSRTLNLVLDFIYTGGYQRGWDASVHLRHSPAKPQKLSKAARRRSSVLTLAPPLAPDEDELSPSDLYREFSDFVQTAELGDAETTGSGDILLHAQILALNRSLDVCPPDTAIRGSDGDVLAHQVILTGRCAFFAATMDTRWSAQGNGTTLRDDGPRVVLLPHVRCEVLHVVLGYIYGKFGDAIFAECQKPTVPEFVAFVTEVLACADELMLEGLKKACESVTMRSLCVGNAVDTLVVADWYGCVELKDRCLDFICWNLETMVENRALESLLDAVDDEEAGEEGSGNGLLQDLEDRVRALQGKKLPYTRGSESPYARAKDAVVKQEEERKLRRRRDYELRRASAPSPAVSSDSSCVVPVSAAADQGDELFVMELGEHLDAPISETAGSSSETGRPSSSTPTPRKKGRAWTKLDVHQPPVSPSPPPVTPTQNKSWAPVPVLQQSAKKISLKDIMAESTPVPLTIRSLPPAAPVIIPSPPASSSPSPPPVTPSKLNGRDRPPLPKSSTPRTPTSNKAVPSRNTVSRDPTSARPFAATRKDQQRPGPGSVSTPRIVIQPSAQFPQSFVTQASSAKVAPPISSPAKMSQKERRRLAATAAAAVASCGPPPQASPTPSSPWAKPVAPANSNHPPPALREIITHQHTHDLQEQQRQQRSFASIQEQQTAETRARTRMMRKPLERIQVEERAIKQLLEFYQGTSVVDSGEWISVDRQEVEK